MTPADRPGRPPSAAAAYPVHLDTGARALDALDGTEAAVFDGHLTDCEPCRIELAEFLATAAALGAAVSQAPPAGVRARVMAAVAVLPQLPPVVPAPDGGDGHQGQDDRGRRDGGRDGSTAHDGPAGPGEPVVSGGPAIPGRSAVLGDVADPGEPAGIDEPAVPRHVAGPDGPADTGESAGTDDPAVLGDLAVPGHRRVVADVAGIDEPAAPRHVAGPDGPADTGESAVFGGSAGREADAFPAAVPLRRAWYQRPALLMAAAALVAVLAVGAVVLATRPTAQSADATTAAMEQCVAAAPDAQMMRPAVGVAGDVMMAHSCHAAVVRVDGLPTLPSGQTYQLWVMAPSGARSVGTLGSAPGSDHPMVAALRDGDSGIGVSVEPASGSDSPSSAPVWMVHLDA